MDNCMGSIVLFIKYIGQFLGLLLIFRYRSYMHSIFRKSFNPRKYLQWINMGHHAKVSTRVHILQDYITNCITV